MLDFYKKSIEDAKNFLVQYCEERKQAGFFLVPPDARCIFYDALCVRLDSNEPPVATNSEANGMNQAEVENEYDEPDRNPSLSVQRKRTAMLKLQDLAQFFHLPIEKACMKLRLSPTVVKKICRRYGVF
ncbi:hypothetical protein QYF36_004751 [Acer negundo]|nr:hypothetical protein QYF36_004751 [Acer negundo]